MLTKLETIVQMISQPGTIEELKTQICELIKMHVGREEKIMEIVEQIERLKLAEERENMASEDKLARKMRNIDYMAMQECIEQNLATTHCEYDSKLVLCNNYEILVQRSKQLEDQIKSSQQKLKSDANLRKQIETELTYYERQHPIIQANLKISESGFNQFVSDYFQKFVKDMQEVQGYFCEKIIAADQKDFEAFFEIMSIFDFK